ncbi:MAG: (E)-4-hydroxy-3-methylbut-2-enyl-diphosphate synthase [Bacteroidales bacterium]|nr:(E)-4-hydroxy-3-methylbut-2-enyl-diphosphate synthase [Bacteroidales bacterium]
MSECSRRRRSREVKVGSLGIGGDNPVRIQSMTNTSTNDIEASALQVKAIADAGGELVRLTTQGVREASALRQIRRRLAELGCRVPISADVHFNPKAAFEAAETADKVRINPGNFVDAARTFRKLEFTEEEYAAEIEKIRRAFIPFLEKCRANSVSVRLGVNHGSLSDRIMSRYGDTPEGMVESVMEFLRIAKEEDFNDIIISIKSSNTVVMTRTVKLLARAMEEAGMDYPLHLGVTEAGDAEDGRIKSALGIGSLLLEGLGDTIRVSLSEAPENEIPVARELVSYVADSFRRADAEGRECPVDYRLVEMPEPLRSQRFGAWHADMEQDPEMEDSSATLVGDREGVIVLSYPEMDLDTLRIHAAADAGYLLLQGKGAALRIDSPSFDRETLGRLELDILQAARLRTSKTEYISCPSCGRTLFNLQSVLQDVKRATSHLTGLKIGVMGCIVNGPGEMADADYGYVGAGPGRVSIYRGKELIRKNIPTEEALPAMLELIAADRKP